MIPRALTFVPYAVFLLAADVAAQVERTDLASAYRRFESALERRPPDEAAFRRLDRSFDEMTMMFFGGRLGDAIDRLLSMTAEVDGRERTRTESILDSLGLRIDPPVAVRGGSAPPLVRVRSLYVVELEEEQLVAARLVLRDRGGDEVLALPLAFVIEDGERVALEPELPRGWAELAEGDYELTFEVEAGGCSLPRRLTLVARSPRDERDLLLRRLDALDGLKPRLASARSACRARLFHVRERWNDASTVPIIDSPRTLLASLRGEVESLEAGHDPYQGRTGEYWRTVESDPSPTPLRVYAPPAADGSPRPLVIALHGAGGDENMFFHAYGNGRVKRLAEEHGFIVATPSTYAAARDPATVRRVIAELVDDYPIDRQRIYLLGHSLGGMTAARLSQSMSDTFAAVCCVSGVSAFDVDRMTAPTLVITGMNDPIVPVARVREPSEAAIDAGLPIELIVKEHRGHTLFVSEVLPAAVEWLLGR